MKLVINRPNAKVYAAIDRITNEGPGQAYVARIRKETGLSESTVRLAIRALREGGFIERVPAESGKARYAYETIRKNNNEEKS